MLRVEGVPAGRQTLTFDVPAGRCLGILGADPAVLKTLAETIAGLRRPPAGRIAIDGIDTVREAERVRTRTSLSLPQTALSLSSLREHINTVAAARRPARVTTDAALTQLGLSGDPPLTTPAARAAAALISALLPDGIALTVLHEPFLGMDDRTRLKAIDWIRTLDGGATAVVLISTRERDVRAVGHTVLDLGAGR